MGITNIENINDVRGFLNSKGLMPLLEIKNYPSNRTNGKWRKVPFTAWKSIDNWKWNPEEVIKIGTDNVTGYAIKTGLDSKLLVIDLDEGQAKDGTRKNGIELFNKWIEENCTPEEIETINNTLSVHTGSGGRHYYFTYDYKEEIRNSASLLADYIDIRGEGGLIIAPGSISEHMKGDKPIRYIVSDKDKVVQALPSSIAKALIDKSNIAKIDKKKKKTSKVESTVINSVEDVDPLDKIFDGNRNDKLFRLLCSYVLEPAFRSFETMMPLAIGLNQMYCVPPIEEIKEVETIVNSVINNYSDPEYLNEKGTVIPYALSSVIANDYDVISDKISSYIYNGLSYEEVEVDYYNIIDKYISNKTKMKMNLVSEVSSQIQRQTYRGTIENQRGYINFKNGIYDLAKRELIPHSKEFITLGVNNGTYCNDYKGIEGSNFEKFIRTSLSEDLIPVIQEMLGVCLYPITDKVHYFYILTGPGRNGKGVLLSIIERMVPENLRSGITMAEYDTRFANSSIKGKQVNLCTDDNTTRLETIGNFKSVTAGEGIYTEKKHSNGEMIKATLTHISSFNALPSIKEKQPALFDRMILVPFNNTFGTKTEVQRGDKMFIRNPYLKEKILSSEMDLITNWALRGLLRVIDNGYVFTESESSDNRKQEYLEETDTTVKWLKEMTEPFETDNIKEYTLLRDMYDNYKSWCYIEGVTPLGRNKFLGSCKSKIFKYHRSYANRDYFSLKLKSVSPF